MSSKKAVPARGQVSYWAKRKRFLQVLVVKGMPEDTAWVVLEEEAIVLLFLIIQVKKTKG